MKLVSILNEELIFTNVSGVSRSGIYTDMLRRAQSVLPFAFDVDRLVSGMIEREDTLQIPYDQVALPHLRLPEVNDLYMMIGVLPRPVQLQYADPAPCRLVVMSLISADTSDLYLKALAALARFLGVEANRQRVAEAANAQELLEILREGDIRVRSTLAAEDLLVAGVAALHPEDSIATAIDLFSRDSRPVLPVLDAENRLVGELSAMDILKKFIPEYMLRMDNLDFVTSFEPFSRILQEEATDLVREHMREPLLTVKPETPLIQFTVRMAKGDVQSCFVVSPEGKFLGEIMVKDIVMKVLRG